MRLISFTIILFLIIWTSWIHQPWESIGAFILSGEVHIPEVLNLILNIFFSAIVAFLLVVLVEWIRKSRVEIETLEPVFSPIKLPNGKEINRKLLKIRVKVKANSLGKFFKLPANVHAFATLTITINHEQKQSYRAKWDNAPEPWEYDRPIYQELSFNGQYPKNKKIEYLQLVGVLEGTERGYPRMNLLPQALQTENLVPDDSASASMLAKNDGNAHFSIYDPEYYFDKQENHCTLKKAYLKATFKSSLGRWEEYFAVSNPNSKLDKFEIDKISKQVYEECVSRC